MTATEAQAGAGPGASGPDAAARDATGPEASGAGPPVRHRRVVLWASLGATVVLAALFAVIVSAQPSSEVQANSPLLGQPAPAISGTGLSGGHFSIGQFKSEWVLVNFMATWCDACRQEMPQLLEFSQEHQVGQHQGARGGAVIMTVAYDPTNVAQLRKYLAENGASWPAVNDPSASVAYGVQALPSSFLVAPGGTVVVYIEGQVKASDLDNWMRQATAKGLAS